MNDSSPLSNDYIICRICEGKSKLLFKKEILFDYQVRYYRCEHCDFLQTEVPYWLEESYVNSINFSDSGIVARNLTLSRISTLLIYFLLNKKAKFLDYAGGFGLFTRIMRDIGFDFYWKDIYTPNLLARGFEYHEDDTIELITAFEVFEHLENPLKEIEEMIKISKNILFSTELIPENFNHPEHWWYLASEHGQHIAFYSKKTLQYIGEKYNLILYTNNRNIHYLSEKKIKFWKFDFLAKSVSPGIIGTTLKTLRLAIYKFITMKMHSKTVSDMNLLIERMKFYKR